MERVELFKPKFTGQRFDDHTLPFELLDDLSIYQGLLFQVAKDIFYEKNRTRRVPKGFGQGVYLKLSGIEEGSTIPTILLAASTFMANGTDTRNYFEEAQRQIVKTIALAEADGDISGMLSPEALNYFNRIGKNLREDETIDFSPSPAGGAKLTQVSRRKIVLTSPNATSVENEIRLRGHITALDKDPFQFTVQTKDKIKIPVPVDKENYKIVEEAFLDLENDKRVLIVGMGVYNKQNRLEAIKDIDTVVILNKKDVPTQLEKFFSYTEGWMNGEGAAFLKQDLVWLGNQYDYYMSPELLLPFTFPTVEGGIQFEWRNGQDDATLEVNLKDKTSYLHYYNSQTEAETEDNFDLNRQEEWDRLHDFLINYFKAPVLEPR